ASFDGLLPRRPVDFHHWYFGAFELVVRYSEIRFDPASFPSFADPTTSVSQARELAAGLNCYLNDYIKVMFQFSRTDFVGGAVNGDRDPENAFLGRLQLAF